MKTLIQLSNLNDKMMIQILTSGPQVIKKWKMLMVSGTNNLRNATCCAEIQTLVPFNQFTICLRFIALFMHII